MLELKQFLHLLDVYRKYKGYTVDKMCEIIGINRLTWFKWLRGESELKTATLFRICNKIGISWEILSNSDMTDEKFIDILQRYKV